MTYRNSTILLVEDDPLIVELLSLLFENEGFDILSAEHGLEGLDILEQQGDRISAIISDVSMPEMDGYEFCRQVRTMDRFQHVPFVFVSALTSLEEKMKGYEVGGDDYIPKPIAPTEVAHKIKTIIDEKLRCTSLSQELLDTQKTAMQAMTYAGNLGQVLQLMQNSLDCISFEALARQFLEITDGYGLACAIQFRTADGSQAYNQEGKAGPLESNILQLARHKGRFFDSGPRTIINYDDFSVLIKNMPIGDAEKYGTMKDVLGNLCNAIEARAKVLLSNDDNQRRNQIITTVNQALDEIDATFKNIQTANNSAIQDLMEDLEEAMLSLALNEGQEEKIRSITYMCLNKTNTIFQEGLALNEQFERIRNILSTALD